MNKISNTDDLRNFWNNFEKDYSYYMEFNTLSLYIMMLNSANIFRSKNTNKKIILEAACGSGAGLYYLSHQLH